MTKVADLIILNIIFSICCIPIITIGSSVTALYYVTMKMVRNEESYIIRSFFRSFKMNFKQSTIIWLISLAAVGILGTDLYIMINWQSSLRMPLIIIFIALFILYSFIIVYIFPILAKFYNTVRQTFKNSFFMSIRHLPYTIILVLTTLGPLLILGFMPGLIGIWFLIGFSAFAYVNSILFNKIFDRYIEDEEAVSDHSL